VELAASVASEVTRLALDFDALRPDCADTAGGNNTSLPA